MNIRRLLSAEEERHLKHAREVPEWVSPMLATLTRDHFSDPDWVFEPKLDGERTLIFRRHGRTHLMTRNRKVIDGTYPELVDALDDALDTDCILDGEIVAFDGKVTSFTRLQQRMQLADPAEVRDSKVTVRLYLFDILQYGGDWLGQLPLVTRKRILQEAMSFSEPLRYTEHRTRDGEAYLEEACEKGWEGLIAKRADGVYRQKRSRDWLKFKCEHGQELVIGGFTEPHGSRTGFGALLVGYYDDGHLRYAGKVGTGFDERTLTGLRERFEKLARRTSPFDEEVREREVTWLKPELVGEFGFTEWTQGGKLRHPRFLGLRRDKAPKEVVREEKGG